MGIATEKLGTCRAEGSETLDADRVKAYAEATNDYNAAYDEATAAPPLYALVAAWEPLLAVVNQMVPAKERSTLIHFEHDLHFHGPLVPGRTVVTRAEAHSVRTGLPGPRLIVRAVTTDDGEPVVEQYATLLVPEAKGTQPGGPDKPGHRFPKEAREAPMGGMGIPVDADQTYRYRDASGDANPVHVDDEAAKRAGFPGIVLHGACTMAMCGQAVVRTVGRADVTRLKRLAGRFSRPVLPGSYVGTQLYGAGTEGDRAVYAFEAVSGEDRVVVVKDGRAEVVAE